MFCVNIMSDGLQCVFFVLLGVVSDGNKRIAAQGTVVQLKSELVRSQQSRTEAKTRADSLSVITLMPPSEFGTDTVVGRIPGRLAREVTGQAREPYIRMTLQIQDQHIGLDDEDQLDTDTLDLKMTEKTQCKIAWQSRQKPADFDVHTNKSLSEELEALVKAKAVISERQTTLNTGTTGQCCHRAEVWL